MPLILVWNHDPRLGTSALGSIPAIAHAIGRACVGVDKLELKDATDVVVTFHGHAMRAEPSKVPAPLLIIVDLLYDKPERTMEVRQQLAEAIGLAAKQHAGSAQPVEVFVRTFNPQNEAAWFSNG